MLLGSLVVVVDGNVEDLGRATERHLVASQAGGERAEHGADRLLAAIGAHRAEAALTASGVERRATEELRVVVAVTPGVGTRRAGARESAQHSFVVERAFLFGGEVLRPRLPQKVVGDGGARRACLRGADAELVHQRRASAAR